MAKKIDTNPWDIDDSILDEINKENKAPSMGVVCLKRNASIGHPCKGCEYIQTQIYAKNYPEKHPARNWASEKKAKASVYFNVVDPSVPTVPILLRVGSDVGSTIMQGLKEDWKPCLDPRAGSGREIKFRKFKGEGGFNKYSAMPMFEETTYEIPKNTYENLHNLDQDSLIKMLQTGAWPESFFDISSLKMDETKRFRLCPPWTTGNLGKDNRRPLSYVWRHWGLTESQVKGDEPINWRDSVADKKEEIKETLPWADEPRPDVSMKNILEEKSAGDPTDRQCYGRAEFFDIDDLTCMKCDYFKPCGKKAVS